MGVPRNFSSEGNVEVLLNLFRLMTIQQACSQVLRFDGEKYTFRGQNLCFYYTLKKYFSGHNKILGDTKKLEGIAPECSPVATGL